MTVGRTSDLADQALRHEGVAEAATVSLADGPDEVQVLAVALHPGCDVTADDLLAWTMAHRPPSSSILAVEIVDALPRTPAGAVDPAALRRLFAPPDFAG